MNVYEGGQRDELWEACKKSELYWVSAATRLIFDHV